MSNGITFTGSLSLSPYINAQYLYNIWHKWNNPSKSNRIAMIKQVQRRISQYVDSESKTATLFGHKVGSGSQGTSTNSGDSSQRTYFNMTFSGLSVKQK